MLRLFGPHQKIDFSIVKSSDYISILSEYPASVLGSVLFWYVACNKTDVAYAVCGVYAGMCLEICVCLTWQCRDTHAKREAHMRHMPLANHTTIGTDGTGL